MITYTELQEKIDIQKTVKGVIDKSPKPVQNAAHAVGKAYAAVEKQTYKIPKKIMQRVARPKGNALSKYGTSGVLKRAERASKIHKAVFGGLMASPLGMGVSATTTAIGGAIGGVAGGVIGHEIGSKGATAAALRSRYLSGKYDSLKDRLKRRALNPKNYE